MIKQMIATLVIGFTSAYAPAMSAPWLEPCRTASYINAPIMPVAGKEPSEPNFVSVPPNAMGCTRGVARRVDANTTIWRCQVELAEGLEFKEGQPEYGFLIKSGNRLVQELPDELMAGAFENFDVINVNLNRANANEHILAAWNGQSNGMGVHRWTIFVFDANWNLAERFEDVVDWGPSNLVAAPGGRTGCDIAITSFEPVSATASALILRAQLYRGGPLTANVRTPDLTLEVAADRPRLERRYNRAFEAQRTAWFSRGQWQWRGNIAAWLNNPATKARPFSP